MRLGRMPCGIPISGTLVICGSLASVAALCRVSMFVQLKVAELLLGHERVSKMCVGLICCTSFTKAVRPPRMLYKGSQMKLNCRGVSFCVFSGIVFSYGFDVLPTTTTVTPHPPSHMHNP